MAHFAKLDENNIVTDVLVTPNDLPDEGYSWLIETFGGTWIKTSYNASIRKNYAGIGYTYNEDIDAFVPPKAYEGWILNTETAQWESPIPYPTDGLTYTWDLATNNWIISDYQEPTK
jgi:hypothetical protein